MIAACPNCDAKYRVDEAKVGPEGARLRCAKCQAVFRVRAPAAAAPAAPVAEVATPDPAVAQSSPPAQAQPDQSHAAGPDAASDPVAECEYDSERLVLIADPIDDRGKAAVAAITGWGLQALLVPDGVEAMLWVQRAMPRVVVLDAALPKMYGFQVCEIIKRNESLQDTKVVLVGAIHNRDRYRRPPSDLYGADCYLEQQDLPDGLKSLLVEYGLALVDSAGDTGTGTPPPAREPVPPTAVAAPAIEPPPPAAMPDLQPPPPVVAPAKPQSAPAASTASAQPAQAAPANDGLDAERQNAERLARIVVSDIVLYQGEKFDEAIRTGNLLEALDSEIEEGRTFFRQRINETIRNERDHLMDELMRIARERGMK